MGMEVTIKLYENYKGLQITFPTRFLSKEYVRECIKKEYDGSNAKELAMKYQYSERWIRKMMKETGDKKDYRLQRNKNVDT